MTAPRQIIPGRFYAITRRTTQRQYLLRPDDTTNQIFGYCLAEAAARFGMEVIVCVAMSNHYHIVLYDLRGLLAPFLRHLNQTMAKALNVRWSRCENLWAVEQPCATRLVEDQDVLAMAVYTLANPVAADLVARVTDWPGLSSWTAHVHGKEMVIERPHIFFSKHGSMPERVTLRVVTPRLADEPTKRWDPEAWQEALLGGVRAAEQAALLERASRGSRVLGRRAVRKQSPHHSPSTSARRGNLRPQIACRNPRRRVAELTALRRFREQHFLARQRLVGGDRAAQFPEGTWAMRALCAPAPS